MLHDVPGTSVVAHVVVFVKPVLSVIELMASAWPPVLVSVTVCGAELVPTSCDANVSDAGARPTAAGGAVAVTVTVVVIGAGFEYAGDTMVKPPAGIVNV